MSNKIKNVCKLCIYDDDDDELRRNARFLCERGIHRLLPTLPKYFYKIKKGLHGIMSTL